MLVVIGPECMSCQRNTFFGPASSARLRTFGVDHSAVTIGWSDKFAPTPGLSAWTTMSCSRNWSAGPMPESSNSCGVLIAPPDKMTSASTLATCSEPRWV